MRWSNGKRVVFPTQNDKSEDDSQYSVYVVVHPHYDPRIVARVNFY